MSIIENASGGSLSCLGKKGRKEAAQRGADLALPRAKCAPFAIPRAHRRKIKHVIPRRPKADVGISSYGHAPL